MPWGRAGGFGLADLAIVATGLGDDVRAGDVAVNAGAGVVVRVALIAAPAGVAGGTSAARAGLGLVLRIASKPMTTVTSAPSANIVSATIHVGTGTRKRGASGIGPPLLRRLLGYTSEPTAPDPFHETPLSWSSARQSCGESAPSRA